MRIEVLYPRIGIRTLGRPKSASVYKRDHLVPPRALQVFEKVGNIEGVDMLTMGADICLTAET